MKSYDPMDRKNKNENQPAVSEPEKRKYGRKIRLLIAVFVFLLVFNFALVVFILFLGEKDGADLETKPFVETMEESLREILESE